MIFEVAWDINKMGWCLLGLGESKSTWLRDWCKESVDIIGNVYDNPQFLEEKK